MLILPSEEKIHKGFGETTEKLKNRKRVEARLTDKERLHKLWGTSEEGGKGKR